MFNSNCLNNIKKRHPVGATVILINMDDVQAPPPNTKGIIVGVDDIGTVHVHWENGSTLGLVPYVDEYRVLSKEV